MSRASKADKAVAWIDEAAYIARVASVRGHVRAMNNDTATFLRYCAMQRNAATREGFHNIAADIQASMDSVTP